MTDSTDDEGTGEGASQRSGSWKWSLLISAIILAIAGVLATITFLTEPVAKREGATKKTAMLVKTVSVEKGTFHPQIIATGTVEPELDIELSPQVSGRIVDRAPDFEPGGFVDEGDVLLRIESADFRHELAQRKSDLREALSDLAVEKGRQDVARTDYSFLGKELPDDEKTLVLRKPQLEAAKERVAAARAAVDQAELNLRRTKVRAPFNAHVLRRDANVGSQVSQSDSLGRLVGIDTYWVAVELPLTKLHWVSIPEGSDEKGSRVTIRNRSSWPKEAQRLGYTDRLVGTLAGDTRMARILVAVHDPLARAVEDRSTEPPLMIGEFVEATIEGKEVENVVRINRDFVRDDDTIWVLHDGKLQIREADIIVRDAEFAYVSSGLDSGERVVTTNLSTVVEGAPLRVEGSDREADGEASDE